MGFLLGVDMTALRLTPVSFSILYILRGIRPLIYLLFPTIRGDCRMGKPRGSSAVYAYVRMRCLNALAEVGLVWARLGEASHLVSGPAQGGGARSIWEHSSTADSCWS